MFHANLLFCQACLIRSSFNQFQRSSSSATLVFYVGYQIISIVFSRLLFSIPYKTICVIVSYWVIHIVLSCSARLLLQVQYRIIFTVLPCCVNFCSLFISNHQYCFALFCKTFVLYGYFSVLFHFHNKLSVSFCLVLLDFCSMFCAKLSVFICLVLPNLCPMSRIKLSPLLCLVLPDLCQCSITHSQYSSVLFLQTYNPCSISSYMYCSILLCQTFVPFNMIKPLVIFGLVLQSFCPIFHIKLSVLLCLLFSDLCSMFHRIISMVCLLLPDLCSILNYLHCSARLGILYNTTCADSLGRSNYISDGLADCPQVLTYFARVGRDIMSIFLCLYCQTPG